MSNFPGDIGSNIYWLLVHELGGNQTAAESHNVYRAVQQLAALSSSSSSAGDVGKKGHCSNWGAWGSRTVNGELYTARNLDWMANTGIADFKLLTVYHLPHLTPYLTVGFCGLPGALTGMSAEGITVHEAGDDTRQETFDGFPWTLRLRWLMERSSTLEQAMTVFNATNNTLGINHGVGSGVDRRFVVLETMRGYTAQFGANDPREAASQWGAPLEEAVWRTNHGYDPHFVATSIDSNPPSSDSEVRYQLLADTFRTYEASHTLIGPLQAVNLTALVGDKGGSTRPSFLSCADASKGSNVLSAVYRPSLADQTMWVAFEEGLDASHSPACCNSYAQYDTKVLFSL